MHFDPKIGNLAGIYAFCAIYWGRYLLNYNITAIYIATCITLWVCSQGNHPLDVNAVYSYLDCRCDCLQLLSECYIFSQFTASCCQCGKQLSSRRPATIYIPLSENPPWCNLRDAYTISALETFLSFKPLWPVVRLSFFEINVFINSTP